MEELLQVKDLSISFHTYNGEVQAVRNASFDLHPEGGAGHRGRVWQRQERNHADGAEVDTLRAEKRPDYL